MCLGIQDIVYTVLKDTETTLIKNKIQRVMCLNNTGLIYAHVNKTNGAMYIGQTINNIKERSGRNGILYKECPYFSKAIDKYGWDNFDHIILEDNIPVEILNDREIYWIDKYHTCINDPEYVKGYNITFGGEGHRGTPCSEETKQKISKSNTGKQRTAEMLKVLSDSHKGKTQSEETKMKRNNKLKGQKRSDEQKQRYSESFQKSRAVKVKCVETGEIFDNYQAAADWLGCKKQIIQNNIIDPIGHKTAKGYHFIRVNNP